MLTRGLPTLIPVAQNKLSAGIRTKLAVIIDYLPAKKSLFYYSAQGFAGVWRQFVAVMDLFGHDAKLAARIPDYNVCVKANPDRTLL